MLASWKWGSENSRDSGNGHGRSDQFGRFVDKGARMRHFEFSQDVLAKIKRDRFRHPDPLVQQRMEVLWLKAHGETHVRIAELAGLARATVQRVLDQYEA